MKTIKILLLTLCFFVSGASLVSAAAPSAPRNLTATSTCGTGKIRLSWAAPSSGTVSYYNITDNGSNIPIQITGTTFDVLAPAGSSHVFTISATGPGGTSSSLTAFPNPAIGPLACVPPSAPTNFTATTGTCGTNMIGLTWVSSISATKYTITRDNSYSWNVITDVIVGNGSDGILEIDNGLVSGSYHTYRITASNANGTSSSVSSSAYAPSSCVSYTVTARAEGGTITPASRTTSGPGVSFTIAPSAGYGGSPTVASGGSNCPFGNVNGSTYGTGTISSNCTVVVTYSPSPINGLCASTHNDCTYGTTEDTVDSSTQYKWNCNGSNGGTSVSCTEVKPVNGSCSGTHYSCNVGTSANNVSGTTSYTWNCNGSNGGTNASCSEAKPVNGSCSSPHNNCSAGTSEDTTDDSTYYRWNCNGSNGGTNASCSEAKPVMSGTLNSSSSSCTISSGSSNCSVTLSWSTTNPVGTSAVTADGMTNVSGNSGSQSFTVPYSSRTFYLYNNSQELASRTVTSSCVSGTAWYDGACRAPINGGWSAWSPTSCPTACGQPASNQTRTCTNPTPAYGGATCSGSATSSCSATTACACVNGATNPPTCNTFPINGSCSSPHNNCSAGTSEDTTDDSTYYRWNCNGSNGGTSASCAEAKPVMSGWISASSCTISAGNSSCSTTVSWGTSNPVSTSAVTADGMTSVSGNSGSQVMTVPYSERTFYLYNNSKELDSAWAGANCVSGTAWNSSAGKCETTTSMSGWISASSCTISAGNSSCSTTVSWGTSNPVSTSAVTSDGMTNVVGNSGSQVMTVPYSERTFYLYNNSKELDSAWAGANCVSGTTWNGSSCATSGSDTLTATGCTISLNESSCQTELNWNTENPVDTSEIRVTNTSGALVAAGNSGIVTYEVPYNTRTFVLVNNGSILKTVSPVATCNSAVAHWDGTKCIENAPTVVFSASPTTIFKGKSSTLTWNSPSSTSCSGVGFDTWGTVTGSTIVSPTVNTTYTLTCTSPSGTTMNSVITKVVNLKIKEN